MSPASGEHGLAVTARLDAYGAETLLEMNLVIGGPHTYFQGGSGACCCEQTAAGY
jgi:hypothetical protein